LPPPKRGPKKNLPECARTDTVKFKVPNPFEPPQRVDESG